MRCDVAPSHRTHARSRGAYATQPPVTAATICRPSSVRELRLLPYSVSTPSSRSTHQRPTSSAGIAKRSAGMALTASGVVSTNTNASFVRARSASALWRSIATRPAGSGTGVTPVADTSESRLSYTIAYRPVPRRCSAWTNCSGGGCSGAGSTSGCESVAAVVGSAVAVGRASFPCVTSATTSHAASPAPTSAIQRRETRSGSWGGRASPRSIGSSSTGSTSSPLTGVGPLTDLGYAYL